MQEAVDEKELMKEELNLYKNKYTELLKSQESIYLMLESKDQEISALKMVSQRVSRLEIEKQPCVDLKSIAEKITEKKPSKAKLIDLSIEKKSTPDIALIDPHDCSDQIQFYLSETLSKLKLEGLFVKSNEQYYKVGCRKVGVMLKNGNIYCKIGEVYKTLENYIYSHCSQEVENFIKKRANSKPSHRRFNTFSSSFDNTLTQINKSFRTDTDSHKFFKQEKKTISPALLRSNKRKG